MADLRTSPIEIVGQIEWSSNFTFLVQFDNGERAIYKPQQGEQPLWDFPPALFRREIAAYRLSRALGWPNIPEIVERGDDAPHGVGSLQRFVDADFREHYLSLRDLSLRDATLQDNNDHGDSSRAIALFDILCNNADRKSGHVLLGNDGQLYAIDNALTFHVEPKLRTVIWDFAGETIPDALLEDVRRIALDLPSELTELLESTEIDALLERARAILATAVFPQPSGDHPFPWPLV